MQFFSTSVGGQADARSLLRAIYESPVSAPIRKTHLEIIRSKEARETRQICSANGFTEMSPETIASLRKPQSNTCFILGSGSSVNELPESAWKTIKTGFSIGINAWVSHDFNADAYSLEADGLDEPPSTEIQAMSDALARKARDNPETALFLLRPKRAELQKRMAIIPSALLDRSVMYGRFNLTTRNTNNLVGDLTYINRTTGPGRLPLPVVIDNGASVSRMISIAVVMGFRKVVLVGVDLNSGPYFWQANAANGRYPDLKAHYPRQSGALHDTLETVNRPFPTDKFIVALSSSLRRRFGISVSVGSEHSALSACLPLYDWSNHTELPTYRTQVNSWRT